MGLMLRLDSVSCGYGANEVVKGISFTLQAGDVMCLLGANGSGKTTLFRAILRFIPLSEGSVSMDGESIEHWSRRKLARTIAYVPQAHTPPFAFKVRDVVLMARTAHMNSMGAASSCDHQIVDQSLDSLGIMGLANKEYTQLSGGERQMVLVARALAQEAKLLVMDEPASSLDFGNQIRMLTEVKRLSERGVSVLITTHSPNHAFLCASQVAVMKAGRLLACGLPDLVLTSSCLEEAYGVPLEVIDIGNGNRTCVPLAGRLTPQLHRENTRSLKLAGVTVPKTTECEHAKHG
jgi:iron complex transport system ATP-binding protein